MTRNIKAILFDIDGVLLDSFLANYTFVCNILKHYGYACPTLEEYVVYFHRPGKEAVQSLAKLEAGERIEMIWEDVQKNRDNYYQYDLLKTPDRMHETVEVLSKNYVLGLVTSRIRSGIYTMPPLANLQEHFKVVIAFEDTEKHKPYPHPLLLAADRLDIRPDEAVYIGDVRNDMLAAKAAGMKGLLYAKDNLDIADAHTSSFEELPQLIASLG